MVHVTIAIVQVALKCVARFFLSVARLLGVVLVVAVAVVPRRAVRLPWTQTHPAKLGPARLIFAYHVIAAAVFFDGHMTLGTFFGVGRYPVRCFRVVVALFDPLFEPFTFDRIVPKLAAAETKRVPARTLHQLSIEILHFDGVCTIRRRTPAHETVAFDKAVRYQVLIL